MNLLPPLETQTIFTPFGIRFWDPVSDRPVTDGLLVMARPPAPARSRVEAFRTRAGVYAFQGLPGLQAVEYPAGDPQPLASPPVTGSYLITVADRRRRFIPVAFEETLPLPYRGLFPGPAPGSPPEATPPGFYLFSAPTRPVAPGLAVVRAELIDQTTERPAAHAVLTVQAGDAEPWYGLADAQGRVAVFFPYPTFSLDLSASPPGGPPPGQQTWPLTIRVSYAPAGLRRWAAVALPDFRTIITQGAGRIHPTNNPADPALENWSVTLTYGRELILRTSGLAALLISPAASLP